MKPISIKILFVAFLITSSQLVLAQGPPDPPGDPGSGGDPVPGGGAPVGSGVVILVSLAAIYSVKKYHAQLKNLKYWDSLDE